MGLWGILLMSASAAGPPPGCPIAPTVCSLGCDFVSLDQLVAASPPGQDCTYDLPNGTFPGPVRVMDGRRILLRGGGAGQVTLVSTGSGPGLLQVSGGSTLALEDITVSGFQQRAIEVTGGSTLDLTRTVVTSLGSIQEGGGLRSTLSTVHVVDSLFLGNAATQIGGAVLGESSELDFEGTEFLGGFATTGAAIALRALGDGLPSVATVHDSTFIENVAGSAGGAVYVGPGTTIEVTDSRFERNFAANGGALATAPPDLTFADPPVVVVEGCVFGSNEAFEQGGALAVQSGELRLTDSELIENRAEAGGGLYLSAATAATLSGDLMCANEATTGGAIHVEGAPVPYAWSNLRLLDNTAATEGGGVLLRDAALVLSYSNLLGNVAGSRGGAVRSQGELDLQSSLVGFTVGRAIDGSVFDTTVSWSVFWQNPDGHLPIGQGELDSEFDLDPILRGYVVGAPCGSTTDLPGYHGPLRGGGDPAQSNPIPELVAPGGVVIALDGSDAGAYGGPLGDLDGEWSTDDDGDGVPLVYDCDDGNPAISPLVIETWYDGVDQNCDGLDDDDQDGDGVPVDLDCLDTDADVYPGAPEPLGAGRDMDCDGIEDHDGDGFAPDEDCDDDDRSVNPSVAEDANPTRDANCDGVADVVRPLVPRACGAVPGGRPPGLDWIGWLVRRRS